MDRYTSMRVFVQAASRGSLSAAGRALGISPAMATKHVDALEARFGVKLLHRTTRGLSLTDPGREYLEGCQRILQDLDEVESDISAQRQEAKGRLRMNVPLSFGLRFIAPLIPGFTERYPMVDVELGLSDSQQNLLDGSWDLIFRVGYLADSNLRARRLGSSPMKVCASPDYLAKHGTPQRVADLSSHNCLSYTLSPFQSKGFWAFGHHGEREVPVKGNLRADNGDALTAAAIRGQGIIYQPEFIVADALSSGKLLSLSLDHPPLEPGGLYVLFSPDRRLPLKVRAMIDYLIEVFSADLQEK